MKQTQYGAFELNAKEYLITAKDNSAKEYEIKYKGKVLKDVVGIIRRGDLE